MKRLIKPISNKPVDLTKRTKLNPRQLEKVRGSAGKGLASRYQDNGEQSLELTRRLAKAKKKARRYVLFTDQVGRRLYIADPKFTGKDTPLTFNRKEALQFYWGFDDPERKKQYYNSVQAFTSRFGWQTLNL